MRGCSISKQKRIAAGITGMLMLIFVLLSAFFIAVEVDHDCTGEDCPVCVSIRQCESTLHQIGSGAAAVQLLSVPALLAFVSVVLSAVILLQETPVSQKVRLND